MIFCVSGALEVIIRSAPLKAAPSMSGIRARIVMKEEILTQHRPNPKQ
jgi:energy-converting hydrogenase Eha subunit C